jgi:hypothetical protein
VFNRMTSNGRLLAFALAVLIAFALPKRVECRFPGDRCAHTVGREQCTSYEIEPRLFYGLEHLFGRNVGFAYSSSEDCR